MTFTTATCTFDLKKSSSSRASDIRLRLQCFSDIFTTEQKKQTAPNTWSVQSDQCNFQTFARLAVVEEDRDVTRYVGKTMHRGYYLKARLNGINSVEVRETPYDLRDPRDFLDYLTPRILQRKYLTVPSLSFRMLISRLSASFFYLLIFKIMDSS